MSRWGSVSARPVLTTVLATLATCVLVALVGWAALVGPSRVFTGPGPLATSETTTTTSEAPVEQVEEMEREEAQDREYGATTSIIANVVGGAVQLFCLVGMVYVATWLVRRALRSWRLRRRYEAPDSAEFDVLEPGDPELVRRTMATDAATQLALLREGEPRNAIVAAWHRFEVQAEQSGLPRRPWETSSEFALRMLELARVESAPVTRLVDLYREARFSEHELTESDREAALEALRRIQAQVGATFPAGRP